MAAARERQDRMTKPRGSLGVLEDVSVRLAGLAGQCPPPLPEPAAVAIFAGDHGVHAQGVSPVAAGGDGPDGGQLPGRRSGRQRFAAPGRGRGGRGRRRGRGRPGSRAGPAAAQGGRGTADFTQGPAMTREQAHRRWRPASRWPATWSRRATACLVTGDMGIANTTASAALICAFTGLDPTMVTGARRRRSTTPCQARKVAAIRQGLARHQPDPADPVGVLAAFGGLRARRTGRVHPGRRGPAGPGHPGRGHRRRGRAGRGRGRAGRRGRLPRGHRSTEPGHAATLGHLRLRPLVDLDLRLGEGTGAVLAVARSCRARRGPCATWRRSTRPASATNRNHQGAGQVLTGSHDDG